jgi:hypothetical protein
VCGNNGKPVKIIDINFKRDIKKANIADKAISHLADPLDLSRSMTTNEKERQDARRFLEFNTDPLYGSYKIDKTIKEGKAQAEAAEKEAGVLDKQNKKRLQEMREKRESSRRSAILNKPKSSLVGVQTQSRLAGSKFYKAIG